MANEFKTALIVDDEEALREIISEVLELVGIESLVAENGMQALDLAAEHKEAIDLFLIDMFMPNLSGEETFVKLDEMIPGKPVIFMSGYDQDNAKISISTGGRHHFLKKPFGIGQLKDLVESIQNA